jgi:putative ABC transport system permease protein
MTARTWIRDLVVRLAGVVRRGRMERRLDDEMRFHLDMLAERHRREGCSPEEARRRALASFGGMERFKDDARDEYRSRLLDELGQDVRYAGRVLKRNPGFATAAALTFALGIGASAAIFSVVHGVLLRPLPYPDPDRLVVLWERNVARGLDRNVVAVPNFEAWRERSRSYERVVGVVPLPVTIAGASSPERVMGAEASPGYFEMLGAVPLLGRTFRAEEEQGGGANVVVLSEGFWRSHYGADRSVLGRSLLVDGTPHTVIGVMPSSFDPPQFAWLADQAFWRPFGATDNNRGWGRFLLVVARLKRDVPLAAARQELEVIAARRAAEDATNAGWSTTIVGLTEQITGDVRVALLVLLAAVGVLLLMAVTNVANLMLGLVRRREHELAVRRAIGATASRLVRQLVTQSVVVGAAGCAIGLVAAVFGARALVAIIPSEMPRAASIRIDVTVLGVMTGVTLLASIAIGMVAAGRGARPFGAMSGASRTTGRVRGGSLITAEIALGLVLTVLAGLTLRTFSALRAVDLGFRGENVIMARVGVSGPRYESAETRRLFYSQLVERVRALPGVQSAGTMSTRPLGGLAPATTLGDAGKPASGDSVVADVRYVDPGVFQTLRIPLLAGGTFDARDSGDQPPRVVINRAMARAFWPNETPIGKHLRIPMFNGISPEVIGVVGDVHLMDVRTRPRPTAYLAATRFTLSQADLVVRATGSPEALTASLRATLASLDPGVPLYLVTTLDALVGRTLARDRFTAVLLATFSAVALLLAAVGIYGVFAGDVAQRRKEIGVRVALGAPAGGVIRLVMRRALARAVLGIALGSAGALMAARAMASLLFGVGAADPVSFASVALLLLAVALGATLIPAVRAARVSPLVAIRSD